jgi:hypothetical protein
MPSSIALPRARRACVLVIMIAVLALGIMVPIVRADESPLLNSSSAPIASRIPYEDPLNSGFLLINMHGMLFHPDLGDIDEDLTYARWLGGGIIRVFATDSNGLQHWDGSRVGQRIAEIAPMLRAAHLRLIVALVNNHQVVPGELSASAGWMDNYMQLLLPFYTDNWRGAYLTFARDLVSTVQSNDAQDVVFAWELGNELHTPLDPAALIPFVTEATADVRALDPITPILPGTMGANHVEPGNAHSSVARWLYCDAPVDAYTLHAYDWVSRGRPGDMPIDWDLDNIVAEPCPNGRTLPVIIEELGTSRELAGVYSTDDERGRLQQELRQIEFVRQFRQVIGFGVWNAESPRLVDRTFVDTRRGMTSYGSNARGGGSCYDPTPDAAPGVRCQLEQFLRESRFVRLAASDEWALAPSFDATDSVPLMGRLDPVIAGGDNATSLTISGWLLDPAASDSPGIDTLEVFVGADIDAGIPLAQAQLGLTRADGPSTPDDPDFAHAGFSLSLPLTDVPLGATWLTLAARTPEHGTWLSSLQVVIPSLGTVPAPRVVARVSALPVPTPKQRLSAEIESPQPGDLVPRSFVLQMLAPDAGRVDVFLEPDRDNGGRLVGSASASPVGSAGNTLRTTVSAPVGSHTLYIHVTSAALDRDQLLTLPVVIRS